MTKFSLSPVILSLGFLFFCSIPALADDKTTQIQNKKVIPALKSEMAAQKLLTNITIVGDKIVALGERGHIVISKEGQSWEQANVPTNVLLTSISFLNDSIGFATGHDATILKTADGGENWELINFQPELDRPLLSVATLGDIIVAVGAYGMYWQSNDMGITWNNVFQDELLLPDDKLFLQDIKEYEPENYEIEKQYLLPHFNHIYLTEDAWYMAGEAGFLAKSTNKGKDWEKIPMEYFGSFFSVNQIDNGNIVVAGLRGNYFEQIDSNKWQAYSLTGRATINDILIQGGSEYLFANSGNLYFRTNGGDFNSYVFEDGKAVMAGVIKNQHLILATEAGAKFVPLNTLK